MERFTHLSLELPANGSPGKCFDISSLLRAYMEDEEVSKSCEHCGTTCAPHSLTHQVARLPQYLALHLKRFQVTGHTSARRYGSAPPRHGPTCRNSAAG